MHDSKINFSRHVLIVQSPSPEGPSQESFAQLLTHIQHHCLPAVLSLSFLPPFVSLSIPLLQSGTLYKIWVQSFNRRKFLDQHTAVEEF